MTYIATPNHINPYPGMMKFDICRYFLGYHYYILGFVNHATKYRSKKYINSTLFTPKLPPFMLGVMTFKIPCLVTLYMLQTKLDLDWLGSS